MAFGLKKKLDDRVDDLGEELREALSDVLDSAEGRIQNLLDNYTIEVKFVPKEGSEE